jgi:hypothetical protein
MCIPTSSDPFLPTYQSSLRMSSSATSATSKDKGPKKCVSFGRVVIKHAAKEHNHFDEEQMHLMWYSKDELKVLRKHVKKILKDRSLLGPSGDVYRGLEVFAHSNRVHRYAAHVIPVLNMQWQNLEVGLDVDLGVPTFARRLNRETVHQGIQRGAQDAIEAFEVYFDNSTADDLTTVHACFQQSSNDTCHIEIMRQVSARMARSACIV